MLELEDPQRYLGFKFVDFGYVALFVEDQEAQGSKELRNQGRKLAKVVRRLAILHSILS